jgi:peptide/nickel transport system substrate-binding protein
MSVTKPSHEIENPALTRRQALLGTASIAMSLGLSLEDAWAQPAKVMKIGISLSDIPRLWAGPDGGFEGMRFTGYTLFDPLIGWDLRKVDSPAGLVPGLATSWELEKGNRKRWIVKLRQGVTFHDGSKFDADAAVWNFDSIFNDKAPQYNPQRSGAIRSRLPSIAGAEKIDDATIAVLTRTEDSLTPYQLSFLLFASPAHYASLGNDWTKYASNPSGTGPFRFKAVVPRTSLELVRNENYWDRNRVPKTETMILKPVPDTNARVAALRAGEIDFMESVAPDTIASLKAAGITLATNVYPHAWIWFFSFLPDSPFKDVRVRKAANLAIDRAGLVSFLNGTALAAEGVVTRNSPWFGNPTFKLRHDPAEAAKLMTEAGFSPSKPAKAKILISASGGGQMQPLPMNEFIQASLAAIGLQIEFQVVDFSNLFTYYRSGALATESVGMNGLNLALPSLDPTTGFVRVFSSKATAPNGTNWGAYSNPAVDAALAAAQASADQAALDAAIARAHSLIVDDAAALFVVHDMNPRALSPRLKGFINPQSWFCDFSTITVS